MPFLVILLYFPGMLVLVETKTAVFSRDVGRRGTRDSGPRETKTTVFSRGFGPRGRETRLQDQLGRTCVRKFFLNSSL